VQLNELRLRAVRARMAGLVFGAEVPELLGQIRLRPHQRDAVSRVTRALGRHGGCLLAEDVGRGKTFIALAVARRWKRPLLVVPASLRRTWRQAMERAGVSCALVTHESLSRGTMPLVRPDGIIVDESHRLRSPGARRHAALAAVAARIPVVLLSATPLQNGSRDLAAQLAIFLGTAAFLMDDAGLARHVVRGVAHDDASLPLAASPRWLHPAYDDGAVLRQILALPRPARAMDAGDAGALRTVGLVRAWASSRAALVAAIRRRQRVATALEQCATSGVAPSRRDLRAWQAVGTDIQLALAPMLVARSASAPADEVLAAVAREGRSLEELSFTLARTTDPDAARAATLRVLRSDHAGARVLAFSEFASTVRAYFALLRADPGVGMLTATEARIASGRVPRDALLDRFAPMAQGASPHPLRERVTLLLATDLLSEGVNLQDASVVVHLDLPWNPARLAQRLGRVRRPGGSTVVHSYLMAPPAPSEMLLRVEQRLRAKLARAEHTVGRVPAVLPTLSVPRAGSSCGDKPVAFPTSEGASAETLGVVMQQVASWRRKLVHRRASVGQGPIAAAVEGEDAGRAGRRASRGTSRLVATGHRSVRGASCRAVGRGRSPVSPG
jgi:superfamily II DNA or RNA helicase